ncbi:nuclear transport factor 2 family protein [Aquimarina sp. 2201CG5-10]|uniref:nuclear transport factor 2 family protein n=1 Tax=Aquimarina callyspongiae TaxID=3098150 RepID=UPI002AB4C033|nr:nuclear transport factor 2 family protein [Aquimarina sp. 2201CG5-10]MDY8137299.1 nuclear transport factor 2 family protein [Aquimarina sp. 2201CG5-10]
MRNIIFGLTLLISSFIFSQSNTEVYLFDLSVKGESITLNNQRNISNNDGYDNQPSFYNDNIVLFSSTRNKQTDIAKYNIRDAKIDWISNTAIGSEYSPTKIPNQKAVSAIRLDTTGKQLLYTYDFKTGESKPLITDLKIGYHTWFNKNTLISSVLTGDGLSLVVSNIQEKTNKTIQEKIGRSLHKIPNSQLISFISKENKQWEIKSVDPITGDTKKIINTVPDAEDMCWLINGTILMGKDNVIYKFNPKTDDNWSVFHTFSDKEINNITRIATNEIGTLLALVSDVSPEHIVQKQVEAYNSRDIDAFLETYHNDAIIYNFPKEVKYNGKEAMRPYYAKKFKEEPNLHCEIKNRIVFKNKVIDEEFVTYADRTAHVISIYEIQNGKIATVTFIRPDLTSSEKPVEIVDKQLQAYNSRDIDAFAATYTDDVKLYGYPEQFMYEGVATLKTGYVGFFKNTPNLNCKIENRIVLGNIVIDKENVTVNKGSINAIAIYEVNNEKISKVTFIQ